MAADAETTTEEVLVVVLAEDVHQAVAADSEAKEALLHRDLAVLDQEKKVVLVAIEHHVKADLVAEEAKAVRLRHVVKVVFLTVRQELRLAMHQEEIQVLHREVRVLLKEHHVVLKVLVMRQDQEDQEKSNLFINKFLKDAQICASFFLKFYLGVPPMKNRGRAFRCNLYCSFLTIKDFRYNPSRKNRKYKILMARYFFA